MIEIVVEASKIYLRIQGSQNTPALFDMMDFDVVDGRIPENWIVFEDEPGCLRFTPKAWAHDGFWTNYFNGEPAAVDSFQRERTGMIT